MRLVIITIFPELFESHIKESLLKRAQLKGLLEFQIHDLRDFVDPKDRHRSVDDRIYGGGPGMLLKVEPLYRATREIVAKSRAHFSKKVLRALYLKASSHKPNAKIFMMDPKGKVFDQKMAKRFSSLQEMVLLCGRYEGFDARAEKFVDGKISLGKFVLSGGEVAAMAVVEAVSRLIPGVLGNEASLLEETHNDLLGKNVSREAPHYTRPEIFVPAKNVQWSVPKVLLSGDHKKIIEWRQKRA